MRARGQRLERHDRSTAYMTLAAPRRRRWPAGRHPHWGPPSPADRATAGPPKHRRRAGAKGALATVGGKAPRAPRRASKARDAAAGLGVTVLAACTVAAAVCKRVVGAVAAAPAIHPIGVTPLAEMRVLSCPACSCVLVPCPAGARGRVTGRDWLTRSKHQRATPCRAEL